MSEEEINERIKADWQVEGEALEPVPQDSGQRKRFVRSLKELEYAQKSR
jgi:hypothetical protein